MKLILIKLLKSDSKYNEELLNILSKSLVDIVKQGYKYDFTFAQGDGVTKYPIMVFDGKPYTGLVQIRTGITTIMKQYQMRQMRQKLNSDDMHTFQMDKLMDSDSESDAENNVSDIQSKMDKFNKYRGSRASKDSGKDTNNTVVNNDNDEEPKTIKPINKKKHKKHKKHVSKPTHEEGSNKNVIERMQDDDIGGAFKGLGGDQRDNKFLENMFANQQETDLSGLSL
jgi:hypothetical protein